MATFSIDPDTHPGPIHLHVSDLQKAVDFYQDVLGFDLVTRYGPQAAFLSAGGYHHHIGLNTWAGVGASPTPDDSVGLDYFTIYLPQRSELDEEARRVRESGAPVEERGDGLLVRDPSENGILLAVEAARVAGR
jgi:catechol 2,3-dioxygenase